MATRLTDIMREMRDDYTRESTMDALHTEINELLQGLQGPVGAGHGRTPLTKAIRDYSETIAKYFEEEAAMALQAAKESAERYRAIADSARTQGDAIAAGLAELLDNTARKMKAEYHEG